VEIEKVSYYRYDAKDQRHIVMSLPRVRWLERDPDYKPPAPPDNEQKVDRRKDNRVANRAKTVGARGFRPEMRSDELTPHEANIWAMHRKGLMVVQIASELGLTVNAASKALNRAREKQGIGLE
jgi:DNA-directed RNA polymerase specialized sigma24 family protein